MGEENQEPGLPEAVPAPAYQIVGLPLVSVHVPALGKTYDLGQLTPTDVDELLRIDWPYIERA